MKSIGIPKFCLGAIGAIAISTSANSDGAVPVDFFLDNVSGYMVPEPFPLALAGLGAAALLIFRRRN